MRNHPDSRLEKIQEIGRQLVENDIMTNSVQADVEALDNRWADLNEKVKLII